jgi:hypothetical protein
MRGMLGSAVGDSRSSFNVMEFDFQSNKDFYIGRYSFEF